MLVIKRKKAIIHMIIFVSPVTKIVETRHMPPSYFSSWSTCHDFLNLE